MNKKKFFFAVLAVFSFIVIFEWLFHGIFLENYYSETQELWRGKENCIFWAMISGQLLFSAIFSVLYLRGFCNGGISEGAQYGALIGLLMVPMHLIFYAVQPLPLMLAVWWSAGGVLEMLLAGMIFGAIYRLEH